MSAGHLWLASFLVFPIVGAPLFRHPAFRAFGLPTRAVLSGGVGMVLLSWTMTAFSVLRLRWGPLAVLVAAAIAFALRLLLGKDDKSDLSPPAGEREAVSTGDADKASRPRPKVAVPAKRAAGADRGEGRFSRAATLLACSLTALALLAAFAATASARATSPDLLLFWGPKAQQFATARTIDVGFLKAPFLEYIHVYYPPLVTNVFAFGAMVAGRFPWGAATLTFPLLLAATAIGLAGILKTESGAAPAAATSALVTSAIALLGIHASVAGNAEPYLLFFEILAVALLLTPVAASTGGKLVAGLLLAGAATSKVEGLPFVFATALLFILVDRKRCGPVVRTVLLMIGPTIVALGTWFAFGRIHELFRGYQGYGKVLAIRWDNLPEVATAIARALWKVGYALPWLVPVVVLLLAGARGRRALLPIGVGLTLAGFLLFTYLTTESDPRLLIAWSAARTLSPLTALFALAALPWRAVRRDTPPPSSG